MYNITLNEQKMSGYVFLVKRSSGIVSKRKKSYECNIRKHVHMIKKVEKDSNLLALKR